MDNTEHTEHANPLLRRATIPGQTFALPSGGIFYTNGELDESAKGGEVVVSPMVTLDEMIMKTPDKILNGSGIGEVFARCIPQIKKPNEMLAKDIDFLFVCLRKITYGPEFQIEHTHTCENAKSHTYVMPLDPLISSACKLDVTSAKQDYTLTLPNEQVVELIPPRYFQMLQFYQSFNTDVSDHEAYERMITATVSLVSKVDGITDRTQIEQWVRTVPAGYTKKIGERVAEMSKWGPQLKSPIVCRDCQETVEVDISLNPMHFFS